MFDVLEHDCLSEPECGSASDTLRHVILDTVERSNGRCVASQKVVIGITG
jgi:hypothetical protein